MIATDVKLIDKGGYYDIDIADGDIVGDDSFNSYIITSIFTDARASAAEVADEASRRGWIGNLDHETPIGSKLWLYQQERLVQESANSIASVISASLKRLEAEGLVDSVDTVVNVVGDKFVADISVKRFNGSIEHLHYTLWGNTGE